MENEIKNKRIENIVNFVQEREYIPLKHSELSVILDVPKEEKQLFFDLIDELLAKGDIISTKKGKIVSPKSLNMNVGTFKANAKGFGFVSTEDPLVNDVFIPAALTNSAMHLDKVLFKILKANSSGKKAEGEIIKIIERTNSHFVGCFEKSKNYGFVVPDNKKIQDIFISKENSKNAVTGHKVVVDITRFANGSRNPEGKIIEILGHINDPGVDIISVVRQHNLPLEFPEEVYVAVEDISLNVSDSDTVNRTDLTDVLMVTIDGEDAKDLDDAVSLELLENGNYNLGVHIADVSHYVTENSVIDKEAYARGTSVYLVDRVIPMLPHALSNGICSLNPNVLRLTLSCVMEIDKGGNVVNHNIFESYIKTECRMTYTDVNEILTNKNEEVILKYKELVPMFQNMEKLRNILKKKRTKRGSVNFDLPESKVILDETGKPIDIKPYERNVATSIIEEFMLICNETVAEDYFWQDLPFVFRNHEKPADDRIVKLQEFISNFGYHVKGKKDLHPKAIAEILDKVIGTSEETIISRVILRSMKQAKYMDENLGHFGLASKCYTHFTSPIRRYPDLQIHRIIKENLNGGINDKRYNYLKKVMPDITNSCSVKERTAEDAERETITIKKVQYMVDKVSEIYDGIISGVTSWGIFVELPNTVEGMISVSALDDDYYIFDEQHMMFIGERNRKVYRLGDKVQVQVASVSIELREINFNFV